jgi:HD-GYP domain-containing protein (c-di-GMP phosphodiesterase class II)
VGDALDLARLLELARWLDPQISADAEHSTRVSRVALALADAAGLGGRDAALATLGGLLHDVGKVAVPMPILVKPGPLDDREFDQVKRHPAASGALVVRANMGDLGVLLRHHHERWDGLGYPDGLAGKRIPLVARVLAIADAYDAMLADRPYRASLDPIEARRELEQGAGTQFDPHLVEVFLGLRSSQLRRAAA